MKFEEFVYFISQNPERSDLRKSLEFLKEIGDAHKIWS